MYCAITATQQTRKNHRQLISRHFCQIHNRTDGEHDLLCNMFAITFRPGNRTNCFSEPIHKLGQGVLICLTYEWDQQTGRRRMPIIGLRARLAPDGFVTYGGERSVLFCHDCARRPSIRSRQEALNPLRNPSLTELALRMDRACQRALGRSRWLPSVPLLPQVLAGFPASQVPCFEDSFALRKLAAIEMGIAVEKLGRNGEELLLAYLKDLWLRQIWRAGDPINTTGSVLLNTEFCSQLGQALSLYEDYHALLGAPISNPARRLEPVTLENPAAGILQDFGIDSLEQPITEEQLAAMVRAFRQTMGPKCLLSETDVYDGFTHAEQPLRAWSPRLGDLRAHLEPSVRETVTDDDLLRAAAASNNPLIASRGCIIQILQRRRGSGPESLRFSPEVLDRRIALDLTARHPYR